MKNKYTYLVYHPLTPKLLCRLFANLQLFEELRPAIYPLWQLRQQAPIHFRLLRTTNLIYPLDYPEILKPPIGVYSSPHKIRVLNIFQLKPAYADLRQRISVINFIQIFIFFEK